MNSIVLAKANDPAMDSGTLRAMFAFRQNVFGERLGWQVESHNGLEMDRYDALSPVYMVARNNHRQVEGCWRLLPTTGPYMLKNTFPELLRGEVAPRDPAIWELSRFAVDSPFAGDLAQANLSPVTFAMLQAMFDFAQRNGIRSFVTATSVAVERLFKRLGISLSRFGDGKAQRLGKVLSVACRVEINDQLQRVLSPDLRVSVPENEVAA